MKLKRYKAQATAVGDCNVRGYSLCDISYTDCESDGVGDGSGCYYGDSEDVGTCWTGQNERPFQVIPPPYNGAGNQKGTCDRRGKSFR